MKKFLLLVLVLALALSCVALADGSVEAITDKGVFILGLDDSFPPMGYRDENNDIVGFDIDTARAVCEVLGVELQLQPIAWESKELELNANNIDCIWNGLSINPARLEAMSMTFPYMSNAMILYAKSETGIADYADLAGKKVGVQSGSHAESILTEGEAYAETAESLDEVLSYDDYLVALMDLQAGNIDAVLADKVVAEFKLATIADNSIVAAIEFEDDLFGIGFRKGDVELRDKVQEILKELDQNGTLAEISAKWFGSDITLVKEQ